jgi:hypothetical protein
MLHLYYVLLSSWHIINVTIKRYVFSPIIMQFLAKRTKDEGNTSAVTQNSGEQLTYSFNHKEREDSSIGERHRRSRTTANQASKQLQCRVKQHATTHNPVMQPSAIVPEAGNRKQFPLYVRAT